MACLASTERDADRSLTPLFVTSNHLPAVAFYS